MEDYFYSPLVLSVIAIALMQLLKLALKPAAARLPPGPWELPIIGCMHHLMNVLPHRALRDLAAKHGPLMMLRLGQTPLVVVSSKETARAVLKTHDNIFANRAKLHASDIAVYKWADIIFSPTGDYWRKVRQLCTSEILSTKRVLSFRQIREAEVMLHVEEIRAMGPSTPVNMTMMFHSITNSIVSRAALGGKRKNAQEFMAATKALIRLLSGFNIPDLFPTWTTVLGKLTGMTRRLKKIHNTMDSILQEVIDERRAIRENKIKSGAEQVDENLLDVLIGLQGKKGLGFDLTDTTIKAIILDIFAGGTGTPGSAMEWAMSELMRNPAVMKKLQGQLREAFRGKEFVTESDLQASNLRYLKLVIKEGLRLHPPAPLLVPRESMEECQLNGYRIPAKSRVVINAWAIARDPMYWEDAEEFKPERFEDGAIDFHGSSYEFVPFGSGRRMCPGFNYGLATMELTFAMLLYHFDWSLPEGVMELDMEEEPGLRVRRRSPLILCATPFVPATTIYLCNN